MLRRSRDTIALKGSDGHGPALFVERELSGHHGWRVALGELSTHVVLDEAFYGTESESRAAYKRKVEEAVARMFR